jgi:ParB family chromosome partitioning protein
MTTTATTLRVADIGPNPGQPRKDFDREGLDELAASLTTYGLLEPLIVRPLPGVRQDGSANYQLIAGERRWRAAQLAGLDRLPVIIHEGLTEAEAFELSMVENIVRRDMNPIEEAVGYQQLVDAGLEVATIAARTGKAQSAIINRIKLLALAEPIRKLVADGQLDAWSGIHISKLSHEGQYRVVEARRNGLDIHDVARFASAIYEVEAQQTAFGDLEMIVAEAPAPKARPQIDPDAVLAQLDKLAAAVDAGAELDPATADALAKATARIKKSAHRAAVGRMAQR